MPTRADLIVDAVTSVGGYEGTLGVVTTTTAVLQGLVNASDDVNFATEALLIFPDATNETDKQRTVTGWAPLTGVATWAGATTGSLGTRWVLQPRPAYTMYEWRQAVAKALAETTRTYRKVIPVVPNLTLYPLSLLDWLKGAKDVDAAWLSSSPIMIHNEDFSLWFDGTAPDGWTLSGAGATVQRISGGLRSAYAARVTAGEEAAVLYQSIPQTLVQWITRRTAPVFDPIRASAWIASGTATVGIYDGTAEAATSVVATYPAYGRVSVTPTAVMTDFQLRLTVPAGGSADFHFGGIWQDSSGGDQAIKDMGSQAYQESLIEPHNVRNIGGVPTVEVPWSMAGPGQLVIYSRRHFPELSADTDIVEGQFYRAIEAGTVYWLLDNKKQGQDRTRLDVIQADHGRIWTNLSMNFIDIPIPRPPNRTEVWGA